MNITEWIDNYLGDTLNQPKLTALPRPSEPEKKPRKKGDGPWYTKFPAIERLAAMRLQFWDNGEKPGKGTSRHTLKLRLYLDDGQPINQNKPHWERTVALIDPKKVVEWATEEHAAGNITADDLNRYQEVEAGLRDWLANEPDAAWVKMGHIGSKPGTHYFPNQFVSVRCWDDGDMIATLHIDGEEIEVSPFYRNRSRTPDAPKRHALYDPRNLIRGSDDDE